MIYVNWLQWREVVVLGNFRKVVLCTSAIDRVLKISYQRTLYSTFLSSIYNLQPILLCIKILIRIKTMQAYRNCHTVMMKLGCPIPQQKCKQPSVFPQSGDKNNTSRVNQMTHLCHLAAIATADKCCSLKSGSNKRSWFWLQVWVRWQFWILMMLLITRLCLINRNWNQMDQFHTIFLES